MIFTAGLVFASAAGPASASERPKAHAPAHHKKEKGHHKGGGDAKHGAPNPNGSGQPKGKGGGGGSTVVAQGSGSKKGLGSSVAGKPAPNPPTTTPVTVSHPTPTTTPAAAAPATTVPVTTTTAPQPPVTAPATTVAPTTVPHRAVTLAAAGAGGGSAGPTRGGGTTATTRAATAAPRPVVKHSPKPQTGLLPTILNAPLNLAAGGLKDASLSASTDLKVPMLFGAAIGLFVLLQFLVDRRDPKLSSAPERGDDDSVGFM
jgi:hypothetical protein